MSIVKKFVVFSFVIVTAFCAMAANEDIWEYQDDWWEDNAVMITGFRSDYWPKGTVEVPAALGGKKVIRICDNAFDDYDDIKKIVIADTVKYLEDQSLDCHAEEIILPHGIDTDNLYLEGIYRDGSWTDTSWVGSFFNINYLKKIEFSGGRTMSKNGRVFIKDGMLFSINNIHGVGMTTNLLGVCGKKYENKPMVVPDGVSGIVCQALEDCLCTEISFPSSLRGLGGEWGGGRVFGWTEKLKRIEVRGFGSPYKVIGGSLVDARTKTLVLATAGTEIPNNGSIESIAAWAFTGSTLTKISVPSNVHTIATSAFMDAWRVKELSVGAGAIDIHGGAFASLHSLKGFYIDENNPVYEVVNGCVVDKRNKMLVSPCYGNMTKGVCEVPYFCSSFLDNAFKDEYEIKEVVLPKGMSYTRETDYNNEGFAPWSDIERVVIADCRNENELYSSKTYGSLMEDYGDWIYHCDYWEGFFCTSLPQVAVRCRGRVMAKGFGRYAPGKKVNLTATAADKGFGVRWLDSKGNVVGTKNTLTITMPAGDVCYTVETVVGSGGVLKDEIEELHDLGNVVIPVGHCVDGAYGEEPEHVWYLRGAVSVAMKGLPAGIAYQTETDANGTCVWLTGTATKVGVYKASFTAVYADKKKKTSETYCVITADQGKYISIFDGTKTTERLYAAGEKVSLVAKGPKGTYFAGWYTTEDFAPGSEFSALWEYEDSDYRAAKFFIRRPGQLDPDALYARFITKNEDSRCDIQFECGEEWVVGGEYGEVVVYVDSETAAKVTAKGLPKGITFKNDVLGFDEAKIWPGVYIVEFSAKNLSGGTDGKSLRIVVPNKKSEFLPELDTEGVYSLQAGVVVAGWLDVAAVGGYEVVSVTGLPKGMKAIKNKSTGEWSISGVPTKAGFYTVQVSAKHGTKLAVSTVTVEVKPLPEWASGNFAGMVGFFDGPKENDDNFRACGTVAVSITDAGKISAKVLVGGKTISFSDTSYDAVDNGRYQIGIEGKSGDALVLTISEKDGICVTGEGVFYNAANDMELFAYVWRNEHGAKNRLERDIKAAGAVSAIAKEKSVYLKSSKDGKFEFAKSAKEADLMLQIDAQKGVVTYTGIIDGVKIKGSEFLKFDRDRGDYYYLIADFVAYDKKSGETIYLAMGWDVEIDPNGLYNVAEDFDWIKYSF